MTLIISSISPKWILQVTDRRITDRQKGTWDPQSNKTVLFVAFDGVAILSFTGRAFVDRMTTDTWIARQLGGKLFERGVDPRDVYATYVAHFGTPIYFRLGASLRSLTDALSDSWQRITAEADRANPITISVVGWQLYRRKAAKPFYAVIRERPSGGAHLAYGRGTRSAKLWSFVEPRVGGNVTENLKSQLRLGDHRQLNWVAQASHRTIIDASASSPLIGPDALVVAIPHPLLGRRTGVFGYHADPAFRAKSSEEIDPRSLTMSPWVVSPIGYSFPSVYTGTIPTRLRVGDWSFRFKAPSVPDARPYGSPDAELRPLDRRQMYPLPPGASQAPPSIDEFRRNTKD